MVAELVLQPLDVKGVARAVGQDPRQQKAGEPLVGLGEHEEDVGHRRRAEPLVPDELVLGARRRRRSAGRATVVLARTSEPPCFSVMRHAGDRGALLAGLDQTRVVVRGGDQRLPLGGQLGLRAQGRHDREGHRDRAGEARLGLHRGHVQGGARACGRGLGAGPRQRVQLVLDAQASSAGARRGGTRPRRCGGRSGRSVRRTGLFSLASRPQDCCGSPPITRPSAEARSATQPAPSRCRASTSGRLLENTSSPSSGGTWLKTSWVCHGASPWAGFETVLAMRTVSQSQGASCDGGPRFCIALAACSAMPQADLGGSRSAVLAAVCVVSLPAAVGLGRRGRARAAPGLCDRERQLALDGVGGGHRRAGSAKPAGLAPARCSRPTG